MSETYLDKRKPSILSEVDVHIRDLGKGVSGNTSQRDQTSDHPGVVRLLLGVCGYRRGRAGETCYDDPVFSRLIDGGIGFFFHSGKDQVIVLESAANEPFEFTGRASQI